MIGEAPLALADWLDCRPTNDFVVAVETPGFSEAIVTDCWGVAWRATDDLSREIAADREVEQPPLDHQALLREGGSIWIHPDRRRARLALARLYRHEDCDAVVDRELVVLTSRKGNPIKFVATDTELAGRRQQKSMVQAVDGAVNVTLCPHRDVRGNFVRTQDPALVRLGDLLTPALLALDATGLAETG